MPSALHEGLVELFRNELSLSADLLSGVFRVPVPAYQAARLGDPVIKDITPTERRSDAVTVFADAEDEPVLGVVVEVQLTWDDEKEWVWPVYLATLRATDPDQGASSPELAVLSAIAHGHDPEFSQIVPALAQAVETSEHGAEYYDYVLGALPQAAARRFLEEQMSTGTPYISDFANRYYDQGQAEGKAEGKAEGMAEGMAQAILSVLATRGIDVSADARERIADCTDLQQLDTWIHRAATATTVDDLFA